MFNKNEYINRRSRLKANFNSGILLFLGNEESPINFFDNTYHFRQDSTFLYYFGINAPKLTAIIDEDKAEQSGIEYLLYIEVWYNRKRRHFVLDYLTSVQVEKAILKNKTEVA